MELDRIGMRLSDSDSELWNDATFNDRTEVATSDDSGMEYEYDYVTEILAACHEDVGQITYYRATADQWHAILDAD